MLTSLVVKVWLCYVEAQAQREAENKVLELDRILAEAGTTSGCRLLLTTSSKTAYHSCSSWTATCLRLLRPPSVLVYVV